MSDMGNTSNAGKNAVAYQNFVREDVRPSGASLDHEKAPLLNDLLAKAGIEAPGKKQNTVGQTVAADMGVAQATALKTNIQASKHTIDAGGVALPKVSALDAAPLAEVAEDASVFLDNVSTLWGQVWGQSKLNRTQGETAPGDAANTAVNIYADDVAAAVALGTSLGLKSDASLEEASDFLLEKLDQSGVANGPNMAADLKAELGDLSDLLGDIDTKSLESKLVNYLEQAHANGAAQHVSVNMLIQLANILGVHPAALVLEALKLGVLAPDNDVEVHHALADAHSKLGQMMLKKAQKDEKEAARKARKAAKYAKKVSAVNKAFQWGGVGIAVITLLAIGNPVVIAMALIAAGAAYGISRGAGLDHDTSLMVAMIVMSVFAMGGVAAGAGAMSTTAQASSQGAFAGANASAQAGGTAGSAAGATMASSLAAAQGSIHILLFLMAITSATMKIITRLRSADAQAEQLKASKGEIWANAMQEVSEEQSKTVEQVLKRINRRFQSAQKSLRMWQGTFSSLQEAAANRG